MATTPFPHRYSVTLIADELTEGPRERIRAGAPPQFGGVEDVWSPEHLLIAAALTCLKTTFDAYARHEQLVIDDWRGTATGVLAKGPGGPEFSAIDLAIEIRTSTADVARAESVLAIAARNCSLPGLSRHLSMSPEPSRRSRRARQDNVHGPRGFVVGVGAW